jgi:hypothetical protein
MLQSFDYCGRLLSLVSPDPDSLSKVWNSSTYASLCQRWSAIREAERTLHHHKQVNELLSCLFRRRNSYVQVQLVKSAVLLEAHPTKLKTLRDPIQEKRSNTAHMVTQLKILAEKMYHPDTNRNRLIRRRHRPARYIYRFDMLPILPFDVLLSKFLGALQKHCDIWAKPQNAQFSNFPGDVAADIQLVINGMGAIYLIPDNSHELPPVLRTKHTPWSYIPFNNRKGDPSFIQPGSWSEHRWQLAHHEKEFEWLEAFLRVSAYIEVNTM